MPNYKDDMKYQIMFQYRRTRREYIVCAYTAVNLPGNCDVIKFLVASVM